MVNNNSGLRFMIMVFVGLIIATTLMVSIGDSIVGETNTFPAVNYTTTLCATANCTTDVVGRELVGKGFISNNSAGAVVTSVVLQTGVGTTGLLSVQYFLNDTAIAQGQGGAVVNGSYTYNPDGYVGSGNVAVTQLILIFAALAALIFVIVMLWKSPYVDLLKG